MDERLPLCSSPPLRSRFLQLNYERLPGRLVAAHEASSLDLEVSGFPHAVGEFQSRRNAVQISEKKEPEKKYWIDACPEALETQEDFDDLDARIKEAEEKLPPKSPL